MLKAADVMTRDVATVRASATVAEAVALMNDRGWRSLIVDRRDEQDAYGIISETDIAYKVLAKGKDPTQVRVYQVMTKPCITVNPDLSLPYVAQLFAQTGIVRAPVIREHLIGIISVSDLLAKGEWIETPLTLVLDRDLQDAIEEAQVICSEQGARSPQCGQAWAVVDAIEAELARHRCVRLVKTAFEAYCEEYPDVLDAQLLENCCSG